ncbi:tRNA (cytosine-5-)-methyltransferase ncl1, partial [Bonamia ostreae]
MAHLLDKSSADKRKLGMKKLIREEEFNAKYYKKLDSFIRYYRKQGVLYSEEDAAALKKCLKTELPVCFWFSGKSNGNNKLIESFSALNQNIRDKFQPLKWYSLETFLPGFKTNISKREMKKIDENSRMHKWLTEESDFGNIVRQEEVSMIPPITLDIEPSHKVLDMCAAPGSKTCQIVEKMKKISNVFDQNGFVVAVDSNFSRCHVLAKRVKELGLPNVTVINTKA